MRGGAALLMVPMATDLGGIIVEHPNATRIRNLFVAGNAGDFEAADALAADDIIWINDIGAGPWHELVGKSAVLEFSMNWQVLFDGTWTYDILDACGSDSSVVLVMREHGVARGLQFDNHTLYHFSLDSDGRVERIQTYDRDREAIIAFWQAIGPVATSPAIE